MRIALISIHIENTEAKIDCSGSKDKLCLGIQSENQEVMLFLTSEQAERVVKEIEKRKDPK